MSSANAPRAEADGQRFISRGFAADALTVAHIREEFGQWLRCGAGVDDTLAHDVILAVNEALANAAEFAYPRGGPGTADLEAVRDVIRGTLTVTVSDRGLWRESNPLPGRRSRGRGIPLMRILADSLSIDTTGPGTRVRLLFNDIVTRVRDGGAPNRPTVMLPIIN